MRNIFLLCKIDFMSSFGLGKAKKQARSKSFKAILLSVILFGLLLSTLYNFTFMSLFREGNASMIYPVMLFTGLAALLTITTSVVKVKSIFLGQDYEMLSAMPVTKFEILASKILSLYFVELLYSFIILFPNMIFATIFSNNPIFILMGILSIFLAPSIPMVISCLFAMFASLVADRYKFGNVINIIFYIIFFIAIFAFSFFMNTTKATTDGSIDISNIIKMADVFGWVNPTTMLLKLSFENNPLYLLVYVPANLFFSAIVILFISLFFEKVHFTITSYHSNHPYVLKKLEAKTQRRTLFQNEAKRFFTSKFYFINSISSGIVSILMVSFLGYMFSPWSSIIPKEDEIAIMVREYGYIGFIAIAFAIGIATPASVSISIEGKNIWMLKAYPVDNKALLWAKFWLSTLTLGVCGILSAIILCVLLNMAWYYYFLVILLSIFYVALASIVGLRINLRRYKLDWKNEQECCKNSSAVVLSMLLDWAIMLHLAIFLVGLSFVNRFLAIFVTIFGLFIATFLLYKNTMRNADEKIERIIC